MTRLKLQNSKKRVLIDRELSDELSQYRWYVEEHYSTSYVRRDQYMGNGKSRKIYLHRQITDAPKGKVVDHINKNGLDNRRENLRVVTNAENLANRKRNINNSSGYTGVSFFKPRNKYRARLWIGGKEHHLGYFNTAKEAHIAYMSHKDAYKKRLDMFKP